MNDVSIIPGVSGGMGASLDGPSLGGAPEQKAGLEIGVIDDKIGYRIVSPAGEPIILLFSVAEMYGIMSAQEQAIAHIRNSTLPHV